MDARQVLEQRLGIENAEYYPLIVGGPEYLAALDGLDRLATSGIEINPSNVSDFVKNQGRILSRIPSSALKRDVESAREYLEKEARYGGVSPDSLDRYQISGVFANQMFDTWMDLFQQGSLVVPKGINFQEVYEKIRTENFGDESRLTDSGLTEISKSGAGKPFTNTMGSGTFQIRRERGEGLMPVYIEGTDSYRKDAARKLIGLADREGWSLAGKSSSPVMYALFLSDLEKYNPKK